MACTWLDLAFFTGVVYGLAWLVTRSKLVAPLRAVIHPVPFLGRLVQCIVCTSAWVAMGLALVLPCSNLFSPGFRVGNPLDLVILVAWSLTTTWFLGHHLGDAD